MNFDELRAIFKDRLAKLNEEYAKLPFSERIESSKGIQLSSRIAEVETLWDIINK